MQKFKKGPKEENPYVFFDDFKDYNFWVTRGLAQNMTFPMGFQKFASFEMIFVS